MTTLSSALSKGGQHPVQDSTQVAILLSTYNGAEFLAEQLDSLIAQTHTHWSIHVSDDGSTDATMEILESYRTRLGNERMHIYEGPQRGFAANFLSLLHRGEIQASCFAFCDQDDHWTPQRLERGLAWIRSVPSDHPALFCSRTRLVDDLGSPIGLSPLFRRPPSFGNALVQCIAGGNTMLFNDVARDLLQQTPPDEQIVSHDWWTYLLVTGCGGTVAYEPLPTVDYRQHQQNLMGSNSGLQERAVRVRKMLNGTFRHWIDVNLNALTHFHDQLTPDNRTALELFEQARSSRFLGRLKLIRQSGVHRQSLVGTLGLTAAAILQRI